VAEFVPFKNNRALARAIKISLLGSKPLRDRYPQMAKAFMLVRSKMSARVQRGMAEQGKTLPGGVWKVKDGSKMPAWHRYFIANGLRKHHHRKVLRIVGTLAGKPILMRNEDISKLTGMHVSSIARVRAELKETYGDDRFPRRRRDYSIEMAKRTRLDLNHKVYARWAIIEQRRKDGWTLQQIAESEGVSRQRIHQILQRLAVLDDNHDAIEEKLRKEGKIVASTD
jgi:hypothetical protein